MSYAYVYKAITTEHVLESGLTYGFWGVSLLGKSPQTTIISIKLSLPKNLNKGLSKQ